MKLKNKRIIIISFVITIVVSLLFLLATIILLSNRLDYNTAIKNNTKLEIKKIVLVGDSRLESIHKDRKKLNIPQSVIFDAKSGARINWFLSDGIPNLYEIIKNKNYKYNVIFNLGVNDLYYTKDVEKRADEYYKLYRNIVTSNQEIEFYFLSVNSIDEKILKDTFGQHDIRTNKKIQIFNNKIKEKIEKDRLSNFKYCDSYNSLDFIMPDGLHYDLNTNKNILSFIINRCVKINKNKYYKKHTI